jgi:hypothetical protein
MIENKIQLIASLLMGMLSGALAAPSIVSRPRDTLTAQTTFVNVYNSPECGTIPNTYLIQLGITKGSVGPTNCPIYPSDQLFTESPDGTFPVYFSPPSEIFEGGGKLVIRTPAANGENQCGAVTQIISQTGCFLVLLGDTFVLQSCKDPQYCTE